MIRQRPMGMSDQEAYDTISAKVLGQTSEEEAATEVDAVEDMWRGMALNEVGQTFVGLRENCLKGIRKGKKTRSYYILKYFLDFITLNKLSSSHVKYFLKWVKACERVDGTKFKDSNEFKKLKEIFADHKSVSADVKSILPFLLKKEGIKLDKKGA